MPYEAYFKSAAESLLVVDLDGRIVDVNAATEPLFGYARNELLGQAVEILLPERLRDRHPQHRAKYVSMPRSRPMGIGMDLAGRRKDGSEFPIEVSLTFAHSDDGDYVISAIVDISERLALEREARRNAILSSLGAVAAGVVHDLNNPLGFISTRAELMLSDEELSAQARDDLREIHNHAQRASRVCTDLLALASHGPTKRQSLNLNRIVDEAVMLVSGELRRDNVIVRPDLDSALPQIEGDPNALGQVFINLMLNARDAMPEGGELRIVSAPVKNRPGWIAVTIKDQGTGISAEALPRLFDFLYTTKADGHGLGLWLSRRIMREHRGNIEVQSEPGKGAIFSLSFPVAGAK